MKEKIINLLLEIYTEDEAEKFYTSKNKLLNNKSAQELVEAGESEKVIYAIQSMIDCNYI